MWRCFLTQGKRCPLATVACIWRFGFLPPSLFGDVWSLVFFWRLLLLFHVGHDIAIPIPLLRLFLKFSPVLPTYYFYPSSMFFDLLPCSSAVSPGARRRKADPKKRSAITSGGQMLPEMVVMRDQKRDVVVTMMQRKGTMML